MARMQLGGKRVTPDAIEKWKAERGYDRPLFFNEKEQGVSQITNTLFLDSSLRMFAFDFGRADSGRDIASEIIRRAGPSIALALPTFVVGLGISIVLALGLAFFRGTYLDFWGTVLCVVFMSISSLFFIVIGQFMFQGCCSSCRFQALHLGSMPGVFGVAHCGRYHGALGWRDSFQSDLVHGRDWQGLRPYCPLERPV